MKYLRTKQFVTEFNRLSRREQQLFLESVRAINAAYAQTSDRWPPAWPAALRIKPLQRGTGIWEMTWSFAGPDGRATFEFVILAGEPAIKWRRVGGHDIFQQP